jgi:hypothetical protein
MQRETVTVMPSCSGGGYIVVVSPSLDFELRSF